MTRDQLEHVLRAASAITGASELVVIGSQAAHGSVLAPVPEVLSSMEADLFSPRSEADATLIDGSIGEGSPFHQTFGYYAHGVGEETAVLPRGWRDRLVPLRSEATGGATGLCLDLHDLAVAKLVAGREKDRVFVRALLERGLVNADKILLRLSETEMNSESLERCRARLTRWRQPSEE